MHAIKLIFIHHLINLQIKNVGILTKNIDVYTLNQIARREKMEG